MVSHLLFSESTLVLSGSASILESTALPFTLQLLPFIQSARTLVTYLTLAVGKTAAALSTYCKGTGILPFGLSLIQQAFINLLWV